MTVILHVTDCYDGGVFDSINKFAELCPQYKHVLVFAGKSSPAKDIFAETHNLNEVSWMARLGRLSTLFNSDEHDIIHIHSSRMGFLGRLVPTLKPVIYQPHGISYEQNFPTVLKKLFLVVEWLLGKKTTKFLAVSQDEKKQICRVAPSKKVLVVPNSSKMRPLEQHSNNRFVVTIGQVIDRKDPVMFAEIARLSSELNMGLNFVWIGSGDASLEEALAKEGVEVTGWLDKDEMARYLSSSALYIHTASFEGFPISVIDAAVFGIPIIVRDIPAFSTSKLAKFTNASGALEIIKKLLSDNETQSAFVEISREIYRDNNSDVQRESYEQVISELVNNV
jgi:glycosyltransferase involved in cell wall biosynthesis